MGSSPSKTTFELSPNKECIEVKPDFIWVATRAVVLVRIDTVREDANLYSVKLRLGSNTSETNWTTPHGNKDTQAVDSLVSKPMSFQAAMDFVESLTGGSGTAYEREDKHDSPPAPVLTDVMV